MLRYWTQTRKFLLSLAARKKHHAPFIFLFGSLLLLLSLRKWHPRSLRAVTPSLKTFPSPRSLSLTHSILCSNPSSLIHCIVSLSFLLPLFPQLYFQINSRDPFLSQCIKFLFFSHILSLDSSWTEFAWSSSLACWRWGWRWESRDGKEESHLLNPKESCLRKIEPNLNCYLTWKPSVSTSSSTRYEQE